ncbi:MAG: D-sedoheptulose 7-phosphate isomerase [Candidatus Omnitrophica bacterium]|nr:D-sedoheptulose 7-phosphate isomerase [Candidatus Omnitrophota bacterium]
MIDRIKEIFQETCKVKKDLMGSCAKPLSEIVTAITKAIKGGNKVVVFGNGGSAADSQHMAAELVGRFQKERRAIPAIALSTNTSTLTALSNDYGYDSSFARQIEALGQKGDIAIAISTSGKARNVIEAAKAAKTRGMLVVGLIGKDGGELAKIVDMPIVVPSQSTARIQESHITLIHIICELVEKGIS